MRIERGRRWLSSDALKSLLRNSWCVRSVLQRLDDAEKIRSTTLKNLC